MTDSATEKKFSYDEAFRRNLGFISAAEQKKLAASTVAIAGVGGVGGSYIYVLARLGVGNFKIADLDIFELTNFNRQMGATVPNLGRKKTDVYREITQGINPGAKVVAFEEGINASNVADFLEGVCAVLDALDFFCFEERKILYAEARKRNIFIINIAPTGFGMTLMIFDPKGMTLEEYFDFKEGQSEQEKSLFMAFGVNPTPYLLRYIDKSVINMKGRGSLPCVSPAFFLSAGVAATEAAKILLRKGEVRSIPWVIQYDAFLQKFKQKHYPRGMQGPWQRLKRKLALKAIS